MKKQIIIFLTLFGTSTTLLAALPTVTIKGFSGSFNKLHLTGTATQFAIPSKVEKKIEIEAYPQGDALILQYGTHLQVIESYPQALENIPHLSFDNIDLATKNTTIGLSGSRIAQEGNLFESPKISCSNGINVNDFLDQILYSCTTNSQISFSKILISTKLESDFVNLVDAIFQTKGATQITDLNFTNKNHNFDLKLKTNAAGLNLSATIKGTIYYQKNLNRLQVKITSAWSGIIPITGILFDQLENLNFDALSAEKPYIYLYLD